MIDREKMLKFVGHKFLAKRRAGNWVDGDIITFTCETKKENNYNNYEYCYWFKKEGSDMPYWFSINHVNSHLIPLCQECLSATCLTLNEKQNEQLKVKWSTDSAKDLKSYYTIDCEKELIESKQLKLVWDFDSK